MGSTGEGDFCGRTLQPKHAIANCCCHLANRKEAIPPIARLLWCLLRVGIGSVGAQSAEGRERERW